MQMGKNIKYRNFPDNAIIPHKCFGKQMQKSDPLLLSLSTQCEPEPISALTSLAQYLICYITFSIFGSFFLKKYGDFIVIATIFT